MLPMKYREIVADKLSAAGWSWGYCSALRETGGGWIVHAHREGRRYIVHSFLDGNKRTAMAAAIVFLRLNGFHPPADDEKWEELVLDVAASKIDREQTTSRLRKLVRKSLIKTVAF